MSNSSGSPSGASDGNNFEPAAAPVRVMDMDARVANATRVAKAARVVKNVCFSDIQYVQALPAKSEALVPKNQTIERLRENVAIALPKNSTPLHIALHRHSCTEVHSLARSGNLDMLNAVDADGRSPLHLAAHLGLTVSAEFLLEQQDTHRNATDAAGNTALHEAAKQGHLKMVQLLVRHRADIEQTSRANETPYDVANQAHQDAICLFLEEEEIIKQREILQAKAFLREEARSAGTRATAIEGVIRTSVWPLLYSCAYVGNLPVIITTTEKVVPGFHQLQECITWHDPNSGQTLLHVAVLGNQPKVITWLLENTPPDFMHREDNAGVTPLQLAQQDRPELLALFNSIATPPAAAADEASRAPPS